VDAISLSVPVARLSEERQRQMITELLRARDALRAGLDPHPARRAD
jgi:DNA-binding IclR family transcriptional regulator